MRNLLLSLALCITGISLLPAQNCSINAGLSTTICLGDTMMLNGTRSGLLSHDSICTWTQISGPSAIIVDPHKLITTVKNYTSGTYQFKLSMKCQDGYDAEDTVSIIVPPLTIASAGPDTIYCPISGLQLYANKPQNALENGVWTIEGYNPAGVTVLSPNDPNSPISLNPAFSGQTKLRWTITNNQGCRSYDDVLITNRGGIAPVDAGPDQYLNNCFSTATCAYLAASNGGNGFGGQIGTWSFISGPSVPTFTSTDGQKAKVCDLIEGTYVFRYTVSGPCVNGYDEVKVIVPPATQSVSVPSANPLGTSTVFCGVQNTVTLKGSAPQFAGEEVLWTQETGPQTLTITTPNNPTTTVTGITKGGDYCFNYKIYNAASGCSGKSSVCYTFDSLGTVDGGPDQILPCDVTSVTIPVKTTGNGSVLLRIINGPAGIFTYPTSYSSGRTFTGLMKPGTYRVEIMYSFGDGCPNMYDYVDVTVSRPPTGANAGSNQNFACTAVATQLAGNNPALTGTGTGRWTQVSGPNQAKLLSPDNYICDVKGTVTGTYVFRWTINGGNECPANFDDITVIIPDSSTTQAKAGSSKVVCYNSPIILDGNNFRADETAKWTVSPSAGVSFFPNNNLPNPTVSGLTASTTYTFTYTITNSCGNSTRDSVRITTTAATGPSQANAGADQCLASGTNAIQLSAKTPVSGSGRWSQLSGPSCSINNPASAMTSVSTHDDGTYRFLWTVSASGCNNSTSDTVMATIASATSRANAGPDLTECGTSVRLNANTPASGTGSWSQVSGDGDALLTDPDDPNSTVSNLRTGLYAFRWTISNGACPANADEVTLKISTPPSRANAGSDITLCSIPPAGINFNAVAPASGKGQWLQISGPNEVTIAQDTLFNTKVYGFSSGSYVFRWVVSGGPSCAVSSDDMLVNVSAPANAGPDQQLCNYTATQLNGNFGSIGTWTQVAGPATQLSQTPAGNHLANVSGLTPGSAYTFRYSIPAAYGCPASNDDIIIINGKTTTPDAGLDEAFCNANEFALNGNLPGSGETGSWSLISGPGGAVFNPNANLASTSLKGTKPGTYLLSWTISNGSCFKSDIKRVDNYAPPSSANAGADQVVCNGRSMLLGNTPLNGIGTWAQISGPAARIDAINNPSSALYGLDNPGSYRFTWTITNGNSCTPKSDTVEYIVPSTADAGPDQVLCDQSSTTLAAHAPLAGTGTWTKISGPSVNISNTHDPHATLSSLNNGTYRFVWSVSTTGGACSSTDTVSVVNNANANKALAGADDTLCGGSSYVLNGNMPVPGTQAKWSWVSGPSKPLIVSPSSNVTEVDGLVPGTYIFAWTISSACSSSSDSLSLRIYPSSGMAKAGADLHICTNTTQLKANAVSGNISGNWKQISGPTPATFSSFTIPDPVLNNLVPGIYVFSWTLSNGRCSNTDTVVVNVSQAASVNAGMDFSMCNNIPNIPLAGASIGGSATTATWSIVSGQGTLSSYSATSSPDKVSFTPQPGYTGDIILRLTTSDACRSISDDIKITANASGDAYDAENDHKFTDPNTAVVIDVLSNDMIRNTDNRKLCNQSVVLTQPYHGRVELNDDGSFTYTPLPGFTGIDSFQYQLCNTQNVPDAGSCYNGGKDNAWVVIEVEGCIIPNSFSPDGDGINDYFEIPCAIGDVQLSVYNRWGIEVFKSLRYHNDWDGTYNGAPLPDGTYYYSLKYTTDLTEYRSREGFLTIHR